jgi:hypothetical protein
VGAAEHGCPALASRQVTPRVQQVLDLGEASVDPDHAGAPFGEQILPEPASAVHLDEQAAELGDCLGAGLLQQASLAAEHPWLRASRCDSVSV